MKRLLTNNPNTPIYWEQFNNSEYYRLAREYAIERYNLIFSELPISMDILEVGCNDGDFLGFLREKKYLLGKYTGVDFSHSAIEKARGKYLDAQWVLSDCHKIPLIDNSFDVVVIQETLEHVDDPIEVCEEIYRLAKDGGIIFVSTPNQTVNTHFSHVWEFSVEDHDNILSKYGNVKSQIIWDNRTILSKVDIIKK